MSSSNQNARRLSLIAWSSAVIIGVSLLLIPNPRIVQLIEIEVGQSSSLRKIKMDHQGGPGRGSWGMRDGFPVTFVSGGGYMANSYSGQQPQFPPLSKGTRITSYSEVKRSGDRSYALLQVLMISENDDAYRVTEILKEFYSTYIWYSHKSQVGIIRLMEQDIKRLEQLDRDPTTDRELKRQKDLLVAILERFPQLQATPETVFRLGPTISPYTVQPLNFANSE